MARDGLLKTLLGLFAPGRTDAATPPLRRGSAASSDVDSATQTVEVAPPASGALRIAYAPSMDGDPDAGEVVWTWVPYAEHDGRGKDRPVLVIARQSADRVYAVKLTSKAHEGDRDFLPIGSGAWDSQGRPSWVDVDQVYSVHRLGMRREAAALDRDRFTHVATVLRARHGWAIGVRPSGDVCGAVALRAHRRGHGEGENVVGDAGLEPTTSSV